MTDPNPEADCRRIYEQWHAFTKARDAERLIALYHDDAVLESPLVMGILDDRHEGVLRGRGEIGRFFAEALKRRPDELLRWYRTGVVLTNGRVVAWEYPRSTPDGDQIDLVEVMDVGEGRIRNHRVYWGWFGVRMLLDNATGKAAARSG